MAHCSIVNRAPRIQSNTKPPPVTFSSSSTFLITSLTSNISLPRALATQSQQSHHLHLVPLFLTLYLPHQPSIMAPKAKHFLRHRAPSRGTAGTTHVCSYLAKGSATYIKSFCLGETKSLTRHGLIYAHSELNETISELKRAASAYYSHRKDPRWQESHLIKVGSCTARLCVILTGLDAALAFLAGMEKKGRVPTTWNLALKGASEGDALAFGPFYEASRIVSGVSPTRKGREIIRWIDGIVESYKRTIPAYPDQAVFRK